MKAPAWTRHPSRRGRALDGAQESLREGEGRLIATPHLARDGRPMDMNIRRRPPWPTPPHHGGRSRVRAMSRPRTTKASGAVVTEMRRYRFTPCAPGDTGGVPSRRCSGRGRKARTPRAHTHHQRYATRPNIARPQSSVVANAEPLRLWRASSRRRFDSRARFAGSGAPRSTAPRARAPLAPTREKDAPRPHTDSRHSNGLARASRSPPRASPSALPARAKDFARYRAPRVQILPSGLPPPPAASRAILKRAASNRATMELTKSHANMFTPVRARPQALARAAVPVRSPSTRAHGGRTAGTQRDARALGWSSNRLAPPVGAPQRPVSTRTRAMLVRRYVRPRPRASRRRPPLVAPVRFLFRERGGARRAKTARTPSAPRVRRDALGVGALRATSNVCARSHARRGDGSGRATLGARARLLSLAHARLGTAVSCPSKTIPNPITHAPTPPAHRPHDEYNGTR